MQWHFGPFRLDLTNACLWRAEQQVPLRPKTFALLAYLVTHAGQVVTKEALFTAVWPETTVSEGVLKTSMGEVRHALGETAKAPQWIATVPRRGYRFLAPITSALPAAPAGPARPAPPLVGREAVLTRLHTALGQARQGRRQVLFLTGEPGMGKTAVAEAFTAHLTTDPTVWCAAGQCIEHYGQGEPYLPILEALGQLCRGPGGARVGALLRQQAPTWLVQMPWLLTPADRHLLQQELHGTTRERMLRECAEVLETLTAETPLVLVLEDLHWCDHATVDLLTLLARRRAPARLLLLGTFRPVDTMVRGHPLRAVAHELQGHGQGTILPLDPLPPEAVAAYLRARCPGQTVPAALAPWLHRHTDGNPLFLVTMVSALLERGILAPHEGHWTLQGTLDAEALGVPEGIRPLLEQQIERLPAEAQQVVEVASVAGVTFATAVVAAGLEMPVAPMETWCERLARYHVLQPVGLTHWPDGTVTTHYTFTHALYQQAAYARLGGGRRAQLHQRLGARLEAAYGDQAGAIAAELAEHFVRGQETARAVHYLQHAGENAIRRCAHHEAIGLFTRARELLTTLPETPKRATHELLLHMGLGQAWTALQGYAAPAVVQAYERARALCHQVGRTALLWRALYGLYTWYSAAGKLQPALAVGADLLRIAQGQRDPTPRLVAHRALGGACYFRGAFRTARTHLEQVWAGYDVQQHHGLAFLYGQDPGVTGGTMLALVLWVLGYPAQAQARSHDALALAEQLAHPLSQAFALAFTALLHAYRGEPRLVHARAEATLALATTQGFAYWVAWGTILRGWTWVVQGQAAAGLAALRQGVAAYQATGSEVDRPCQLALLAEGYGRAAQREAGLVVLGEALAVTNTSGEHYWEAELYRLKGELLRLRGVDVQQAASCLQQALAIARSQQAKSLELRAAMSLARLWQQQGKRAAARDLLAPIYGWFTEGFDTADLQEAKALLEELGG